MLPYIRIWLGGPAVSLRRSSRVTPLAFRHMARLRWTRLRVLVATVTVVVFLVLTAVLFVWPTTNAPQRVNAIVVLSGSPWSTRWQKGVDLARDGYAPVLVQSDPSWTPCPRGPARVEVICFDPVPATTQGEAVDVARIAAEHHWDRLLVVAIVTQTTRARIRFERCYHGTVLFSAVSPRGVAGWLFNIAYEWGALGKALIFQRGCGSGPPERIQTVPPMPAITTRRN